MEIKLQVFTRSHPSLAGLMKMGQSIWNTTENIDASLEDSEFELPMLNQSELENRFVEGVRCSKFSEQSMHLNGGSTMEDMHWGDRNGKYAPFDIENESSGDIR